MSIDLRQLSFVTETLVKTAGVSVVLRDGGVTEVAPDIVAAPDGLLPVLLAAGERVWRTISGGGFDMTIERDEGALTGYRVTKVGEGPFTLVMLNIMEAMAQAEQPEGIVVEELAGIMDLERMAGERPEGHAG